MGDVLSAAARVQAPGQGHPDFEVGIIFETFLVISILYVISPFSIDNYNVLIFEKLFDICNVIRVTESHSTTTPNC